MRRAREEEKEQVHTILCIYSALKSLGKLICERSKDVVRRNMDPV